MEIRSPILAAPADAPPVPPVAGYSAWFDASDPASIGQAIENRVRSWADRAPAKRDMTQATDANRPYTGGWSQAGRNVLFSAGKVSALVGNVPFTTQPFTLFLVGASSATDAVQRTIFAGYYNAGVEWGRVYRPTSNAIAIYAGGGVTSSQLWAAGRARVVSAIFNGATSQLNVDGRYQATGTVGGNGNSATQTAFGLGLSESWFGWLGELIVYDAIALTAAQIARVERYLAQKWGIA